MPLPTNISDATRRLNPQLFGIATADGPPKLVAGIVMPDTPKKRIRQHAGDGPTESQIQQRIVKWWALEAAQRKLPEGLLMAFPLQAQRSKANGSRMKAEGMRAGTPDMFLAVPVGKYHGLWIELKRPTGRIAPSQKTMLGELDAQGYAAYASYGFDAAVKLIMGYLAGDEFF